MTSRAVVALDKFKGSLSAVAATRHLADGMRQVRTVLARHKPQPGLSRAICSIKATTAGLTGGPPGWLG